MLDEKPTQGVHCNKPGGLEKRKQGAVVDDRQSLKNPVKTLLRRLLEVVRRKGTHAKYRIHASKPE